MPTSGPTSRPVAIHWFRQDLRLADNPALTCAVQDGALLPIYILDDDTAGDWRMGGASRWWLHRALEELDDQLGGHLRLYRGRARDILPDLVTLYGAGKVSWTRCYEPWRISRDTDIATQLEARGCETIRHNGSLLWEPWQVHKAGGTPYRVFTPFFRKGCMGAAPPSEPIDPPKDIHYCAAIAEDGALELKTLGLLSKVGWHLMLEPHWRPGERGAQETLEAFIAHGLAGYKEGRNAPAQPHVSRLSPYLHWGHISPHQVWQAIDRAAIEGAPAGDVAHFRSELGWREFSHSLLFHNPSLPSRALQQGFEAFDWREDAEQLAAWQAGRTGVPIVDAGMRELWQTGYMHNRVRMIVASFLVKNLRLDWRHGQRWFWDTLVDADLANNSASWQWVAGCGADAAPYFRIFNPVLQAEKFDASGAYMRQFLPELAHMPDKYLPKPWLAPQSVLREAGVRLGETYPEPIVDLKASRDAALAAYKSLR